MDYSSQVVDPTPAHDYAGYADEGFVGYDQMEEDRMFYQPQDVMRRWQMMRRCQRMLWWIILRQRMLFLRVSLSLRLSDDVTVGGPPFPRGLETTSLLSDYARHVTNPL